MSIVKTLTGEASFVLEEHYQDEKKAEEGKTPISQEVKKIGKYKDWEAMVVSEASGKVCFAQSSPILQAPKTNKRDAKLFVAFRPNESISNEVSVTPGYEFNKNNSVTAASGKNKFKFDIKEQGFA